MTQISIRAVERADLPKLLELVREMADVQRLAHAFEATEERFDTALFGDGPRVYALIAEMNGQPAGYCIYYYSFSSFAAKPILYLEDIYVREIHRSARLGRRFMAKLAHIAREQDCYRMQWIVADWNERATVFYQRLGAEAIAGWIGHYLAGDALDALAAEAADTSEEAPSDV
jgi:GNAT superfamily N-acetyltransferase